jgi:hypothetical protein
MEVRGVKSKCGLRSRMVRLPEKAASELVEVGYLPTKPSKWDVQKILDKLLQEIKEAERRDKKRLRSKKKKTGR